jgi:hypothetical protein
MRHSELWGRLEHHLGPGFAQAWARDQVLVELDFRTVVQALEAGDPVVSVWRAAWKALELPASER